MSKPKDPQIDALAELLKSLREPLARFSKEFRVFQTDERYYRLDGHTPVPVFNLIEFATWFESSRRERVVQQTQVGDYWVSTVFLGLNHNYGSGPAILFETMVFIGHRTAREGSDSERYCTWDEALAGHVRICERLRESG